MDSIGSARGSVGMHARCGWLDMVGSSCFVRSVMMVAASEWVCFVQLVDAIEIMMAGEAADEGFHACSAGRTAIV